MLMLKLMHKQLQLHGSDAGSTIKENLKPSISLAIRLFLIEDIKSLEFVTMLFNEIHHLDKGQVLVIMHLQSHQYRITAWDEL